MMQGIGNRINKFKIKQFIFDLVDNKVSNDTFTSFPKEIKAGMDRFTVIEANNITDEIAIGRATILLTMWAKDTSLGVENTKILGDMETALNEILGADKGTGQRSVYLVHRRNSFDAIKNQGFSGTTIELIVTILNN